MAEALDGRLAGKIAIVTGGASGFGEGIVRRLAAEGSRVVIADLQGDKAAGLAEELGTADWMRVDVANREDIDRLTRTVVDKFGAIDILVNNAGVGHVPKPLDDVEEDEFDRIMAVNVRSIYLAARAIVPQFKRQGSGVILNIASTGGVSPRPNLAWYNASKGWVISATRAMAIELAPCGIRVNAINPVAGETPLLATFMGQDTPEARARFLASIPIGRFSTPADIGAAAAFFCSDDASMVTGVAMEVDGGRCI